jgi:hypothetical protein
MNFYKISCRSDCGTYFQAYLQSVTVMAKSKEDAIAVVEKWLVDNDKRFLRPKELLVKPPQPHNATLFPYVRKWDVEVLVEGSSGDGAGQVIDYHEDSDY